MTEIGARPLFAAALFSTLAWAAPLGAAFVVSPGTAPAGRLVPAAGTASLTFGGTSGAPGAEVVSETILSLSGGALVSSLQVDVLFDSSRLMFVKARAGEAATEAGKQVASNVVSPGNVRIVMIGGDNAVHAGVPFTLTFRIADSAPSGPIAISPREGVAVDPAGNPVLLDLSGATVTVTGGLLTGCCGLLVPASASAPGLGGSVWKTRLFVENSGSTPVAVGLLFLPAGSDNTTAQVESVSVAAGEMVVLDDVVSSLFGAAGKAGAILVDGDSAAVRVSSRTYNDGSGAGTFGQGIPAEAIGDLFTSGEVVRLFPVDGGAAFRTNFGLVNATPRSASFRARVLDAKGIEKASRTVELPPWGWQQVSDLVRSWNVSLGEGGRIVVDSATAGARYFAWLSVVDNATGDPAWFPAQR